MRRASQTGRPLILLLLSLTLGIVLAGGVGVGRLLANGVPTRKELKGLDLSGKSSAPPSNPLMMAMLDSLEKIWFYALYGDRHAISHQAGHMAEFTRQYVEFLERLPRQKSMGLRMKRRVRELRDYAGRKDWTAKSWLELNERIVRYGNTCTSCHIKFRDPDPEWFHGYPVIVRFDEPPKKQGSHDQQDHHRGGEGYIYQRPHSEVQRLEQLTKTTKEKNIKLAMLHGLELMWFHSAYSDLLGVAEAAEELLPLMDRYMKSLERQPDQKAIVVEMKRRLKALRKVAEDLGWEGENSLEMDKHLGALSQSCISCHAEYRDRDRKWFKGYSVVVKIIYPGPEYHERAHTGAPAEKPARAIAPEPKPRKGGVKSLWEK